LENKLEEAASLLDQALEIYSNQAVALEWKGLLESKRDDHSGAIAIFEQAKNIV